MVTLQTANWDKHECTPQLFSVFCPFNPVYSSIPRWAQSWGRKCVFKSWISAGVQFQTAFINGLIQMSHCESKRTTEEGCAPSFTARLLHPCPSLDEQRVLRLKDAWWMTHAAGPGTSVSATQSELSPGFITVGDLQAPVLPHWTFTTLQ